MNADEVKQANLQVRTYQYWWYSQAYRGKIQSKLDIGSLLCRLADLAGSCMNHRNTRLEHLTATLLNKVTIGGRPKKGEAASVIPMAGWKAQMTARAAAKQERLSEAQSSLQQRQA